MEDADIVVVDVVNMKAWRLDGEGRCPAEAKRNEERKQTRPQTIPVQEVRIPSQTRDYPVTPGRV